MKKILLFLPLLLPSISFAAPPDVTADAWYSTAVSSFVDRGYLPENMAFRAGDAATRAEFMELVVRALGGVIHALPTQPSFDDVEKENPSFQYFEEAAVSGWMKGVGNCLGAHPCYAKPNNPINRAEAATILLRAFNLEGGDSAPGFPDNPNGQWYTTSIFVAGSHCMLKGDAATGKVRPEQNMNRAEMVVMLKRLDEKLSYPNCSAVDTSATQKRTTKTTTAPRLTQDPLLSALTSRATQMSQIELGLYSSAAVYKDSPFQTSLFSLANQYMVLNIEMKKFVDIAKSRPLAKDEWDKVNKIQQDAEAIGDRFTKVQDGALSGTSTTSRSQADVDALRKMIDLSNAGFKQYAGYKSLVATTYAEKINTQLKLWDSVITQYEDLLDTALDRALTDLEGKRIEVLQQQELSIINTLNSILEQAKTSSGGSNTYTPPSPSTYDNSQYCEDVKNSLGISGGWRSSQKVKEAGRKLLDAGCISSTVACSDYQVCQ